LAWLRFRERVSTLASLRSTLGRWQLNGRFFGNDPDVFILRDEKQGLTREQQSTLLTINVLLGKVLFTSDAPSAYSPEQRAELDTALEWQGSQILSVSTRQTDVFDIQFETKGQRLMALCNLTDKTVYLSEGYALLAFETMILQF